MGFIRRALGEIKLNAEYMFLSFMFGGITTIVTSLYALNRDISWWWVLSGLALFLILMIVTHIVEIVPSIYESYKKQRILKKCVFSYDTYGLLRCKRTKSCVFAKYCNACCLNRSYSGINKVCTRYKTCKSINQEDD